MIHLQNDRLWWALTFLVPRRLGNEQTFLFYFDAYWLYYRWRCYRHCLNLRQFKSGNFQSRRHTNIIANVSIKLRSFFFLDYLGDDTLICIWNIWLFDCDWRKENLLLMRCCGLLRLLDYEVRLAGKHSSALTNLDAPDCTLAAPASCSLSMLSPMRMLQTISVLAIALTWLRSSVNDLFVAFNCSSCHLLRAVKTAT